MISWNTRFLSFAGRLQLLNAVIASTINFWITAYRLPSGCIDEIERLCSAFLWSGPDLNTNKAKLAWKEVCKPKKEGGLGIKSIKDANKVACLKLIWRIQGSDSLWVKWVQAMHLKQLCFWSETNASSGSWMWKKILKYKDLAKTFHRKEVLNEESTFFWYDNWSNLGRIFDITGSRGFIDLEVPAHATVAMARRSIRRRHHRSQIFNDITAALDNLSDLPLPGRDIDYWRISSDNYSKKFSSKATWNLIRSHSLSKDWSAGVWFKYSTPKFSFIAWLAIHDRLATGEKMLRWNAALPSGCSLCSCDLETRNHLFFSCPFASAIWKGLVSNLLGNEFSEDWGTLVNLLHNLDSDSITLFLYRYVFQVTVYQIWRERNQRRHGEAPLTPTRLIRTIDRTVRNRLLAIRKAQDLAYDEGLSKWFGYLASSTSNP